MIERIKNQAFRIYKEANELPYWKSRKVVEGTLSNKPYERFYTDHFGLAPEFYSGK